MSTRYPGVPSRLTEEQRRRYIDHRRRYFEAADRIASQIDEQSQEPPQKRARPLTPPSSRSVPFPSRQKSQESATGAPIGTKVKTEAELNVLDSLRRMPAESIVTVHVGKNNSTFDVGAEELDKSPLLKSWIQTRDAEKPFIMHPEMMKHDPELFRSVREFLMTDEYMPAIVNNPMGYTVLPKQLDGCTTVVDYEREALRSGRLYVMAEQLGLTTMKDLIVTKITQADYKGYRVECLLDLAMVVFSRPETSKSVKDSQCTLSPHGGDTPGAPEDSLETWIVNRLAQEAQPMLLRHAARFFQVANHGACAKRAFGPRVFKRKVEQWGEMGSNMVAIED